MVGGDFKPFLIAVGISLGLFLLLIFGMFGMAIAGGAMSASTNTTADAQPQMPAIVGVLMVVVFTALHGGMLALGVYVRIAFLNLRWNNTSRGKHASSRGWTGAGWPGCT